MNILTSEVLVVVAIGTLIGFTLWKMHRADERREALFQLMLRDSERREALFQSMHRCSEATIQWLMALVLSLISKITELEDDVQEWTDFAHLMESRAVLNAGYHGELQASREYADEMKTYFLREYDKLLAALDKATNDKEKRGLIEKFLMLVIAAIGGHAAVGGHAAA